MSTPPRCPVPNAHVALRALGANVALLVLVAIWGCAARVTSSAPNPSVVRTSPAAVTTRAPAITIGIIGDQTGTHDLDQAYAVLERGVTALLAEHPDVVLHTGDLLESTEPPERIRARFEQAVRQLGRLPVAWYLTLGDHDVNPPGYVANSPDRSREQLFQSLYAPLNSRVREQLYYSFDVKERHFISLYALEHLHTDPRWGNVFFSQLSEAQFAWLERDLAAQPRGRRSVVFLHQPLWYNWSGWARVHELLRQHAVDAVIAGHFHYQQKDLFLDGIQYLVVGATGATTKRGSPNAGELQHVSVLRWDGAAVSLKLIPLTSTTPLLPTARTVMDRVQALDQVLSQLWNFSADNPVFLKGRQLVSDCRAGSPAQLRLTNLGNPMELPLNVRLAVDTGKDIALTHNAFAADVCESKPRPLECRLRPSALVAVANTSSVEMLNPAPALWVGTLAADAATPSVGSVLRVDVTLEFEASQQVFSLHRELQTPVRACPAQP